ncbi:hypothetical protein K435DRAFT_847933 [Dendrothele bispora CBS 962.96]|uniref:GDP-fucose protein O-fucosyltransferase 2 n=1 Tax=Dendrothele bispora (strain CBS 962.96) TaxID=1314807 RepID=A0A4S8MW19_DENBC|nr:hypothetical protein K435DRAFT_847933 [Dendrothele bispora CBS 962.96]
MVSFFSFNLKSDPESGVSYNNYSTPRSRRRQLACVSLGSLSMVIFLFIWNSQSHIYWQEATPVSSPNTDHATSSSRPTNSSSVPQTPEQSHAIELDPLHPLAVLNGPPMERFADNLRPDIQYISSWPNSGWTNDVMTYANLVYLGLITERVPIIPPFTPSHVGWDVAPIPFGDVFDVPRMRKLIGKPILEWREVKKSDSETLEALGCWNVWGSVQKSHSEARGSAVLPILKLGRPVSFLTDGCLRRTNLFCPKDISYTKTPDWIKLVPEWEHDPHTTFWTLARFAYPDTRTPNLIPPQPSPAQQLSLPPDEHLLCYDYLYYVSTQQPFEWDMDYNAPWRFVARYMHWTPRLEDLADSYVRHAMGIDPSSNEPTPPYIAVHVRRHDFAGWCGDVPLEDCFAPVSAYERRVHEVQDEILEKKGITVNHVIILSDEDDTAWWQQVDPLGWLRIDHSQTAEKHGPWYPVLIDAVIQSGGLGFVGTDKSTMSILARRRAQEWHDATYRMVRWGSADADLH